MTGKGSAADDRPGGPPTDPDGQHDLVLVVILGILWGAAFPVIRAGIVAGVPPLIFASERYFLTALALALIALALRTPRLTRAGLLSPILFGGLLMIGAYGGLLYLGEQTTSGGLAAVLTASAPLASALIGYRLLPAERFGRWGIVGLGVGFVGVAVLVLPGLLATRQAGIEGPLLVVAAVLAFATGSVLLRRTSHVPPGFGVLSLQFAVAGAMVGALAILGGESATLGNASVSLPALAFLVVFPGIIGYTLYFRIHHSSGPTRANLVGYVNPVTGVLVGLLIFGETVTIVEIAGLALIALGLFLLQRDRRPRAVERDHPTIPQAEATGPEPGPTRSKPD